MRKFELGVTLMLLKDVKGVRVVRVDSFPFRSRPSFAFGRNSSDLTCFPSFRLQDRPDVLDATGLNRCHLDLPFDQLADRLMYQKNFHLSLQENNRFCISLGLGRRAESEHALTVLIALYNRIRATCSLILMK